MIHFRSSIIIAMMLCASLANAQQNNSTTQNTNEPDPNAAIREKAFNVLQSIAGQISSLQSAENRARIGSNVVGSLWPHDEKRARSLLVSVEEEIKAGLQNAESKDPRAQHMFRVFLLLRQDTVERIAKHDPELALAFLKATEVNLEKQAAHIRYRTEDSERVLELRLAKQIAESNPDFALKMARRSLARGFSQDLLSLMRQLSRKRKDYAQSLFKEIVTKLRNSDFRDWSTMYFAQSLAQSFQPPLIDDSSFRDLINIFITSALANGCENKSSSDGREYFCGQFGPFVAQMERIDPARAAQLKHWAREGHGGGWSPYANQELNELDQNGTVDEILALAAKYPQIEGDVHWRAMEMAQAAGDLERARKIATEYSGDPERRLRMLAQVERYQTWASMNQEKLAEIQRRLSAFPSTFEKIEFLVSMSTRIGVTDHKAALQLLNQAYGMTETMGPGKDQTLIQMGLAMMFSMEKSDRGFAIMESFCQN